MSQQVRYNPTGKYMQFPAPSVFAMNDRRIVVLEFRYTTLGEYILIKTTTLDNKEGEITFGDNDDIEIAFGDIGDQTLGVLDGDLFIVVSASEDAREDPLVMVIHLDEAHYGQYEEYRGFAGAAVPIGMKDNIIYAGTSRDNRAMIEGFNVMTRRTEYRYEPSGESIVSQLREIYDGSRATGSIKEGGPSGYKTAEIVSIPSGLTHLIIEDVEDLVIAKYGAFYVSKNNEIYYSTFQGQSYKLNFAPNAIDVEPGDSSVVAASDSGESIWLGTMFDEYFHIVNYQLDKSRVQKSARKTYR